MVLMESQDMFIIHFHFDQADIDVNGVDFVKINAPCQLIPSSIAIVFQDQEMLMMVTSYFKD